VRSLQKLKKQWFAPSYFFLEIIYSHRIMLAFSSEAAAKKWIDKIFQASVFQKMIQDVFLNVENQQDQITKIQELNDFSGYKELEILDQDIQTPDIDEYCIQFYKRFTSSYTTSSFVASKEEHV
jgi:hypothetical protein